MELRIKGMGWKERIQFSLHQSGSTELICFTRRSFKELMKILSETHDKVSGGFTYELDTSGWSHCWVCGADHVTDPAAGPDALCPECEARGGDPWKK